MCLCPKSGARCAVNSSSRDVWRTGYYSFSTESSPWAPSLLPSSRGQAALSPELPAPAVPPPVPAGAPAPGPPPSAAHTEPKTS